MYYAKLFSKDRINPEGLCYSLQDLPVFSSYVDIQYFTIGKSSEGGMY